MERSQSCSSFDAGIVSDKINNNISHSASALNLRKAIEIRQAQLQQQQQELQPQLPQHTGSSDNINAHNLLPLFQPARKRILQRQKSTEYYDDYDYAADLEEEEDEEHEHEEHENEHDMEHTLIHNLPPMSHMSPYQKQRHFQQHKPQSETALIMHCASSLPSTISSTTNMRRSTTSTSSSSCSSAATERHLKHDESFDSTCNMSPVSRRHNFCKLKRDNSIHSDSSRYSSVDSLLESRKPDPEAILINLGFGPIGSEDILSRIPKRFLKPSQVRGIDTDAFVKRLQLANHLADHSVLGYRGLTGNPDIPPSTIVAKIMQRFEVNERKKSMGSVDHAIR